MSDTAEIRDWESAMWFGIEDHGIAPVGSPEPAHSYTAYELAA